MPSKKTKDQRLAFARRDRHMLEKWAVIRENTDWHWTLIDSQGRKIEFWPTANKFMFEGRTHEGDVEDVCVFVSKWIDPPKVSRGILR